jgi:HlyD family secretion protein
MKRRILIPVIIMVILVGAGVWWYFSQPRVAPAESAGVVASGFIESTDISLSPEIGGRIINLLANEGDRIKAGDTILTLDDSIQKAQINQAAAALSVSQAGLQQALAAQTQASIYVDGTKKAMDHARDVLQNPLEIDLQIAQTQSQLDLAELAVKYNENITNFTTRNIPKDQYWTVLYATQYRDGLKMVLESLKNIKNNPQNLQASLDQLQTAFQTAQSAATVADRAVQTAAKQVDQAQASLDLAKVNLSKTVLISPVAGTVSQRNAEVGEFAQPGVTLLTLSQLEEMTLTVYVPETKIGLVKLGQTASVSVDSYPGQTFKGTVTFISPKAEFTPKNVQTTEERAKTVFAAKIKVPNPEQKLKSGMPADATLAVQ